MNSYKDKSNLKQEKKFFQFRSDLEKIKKFERKKLRNIDPQKAEIARKRIEEIEIKLKRLKETEDFREKRRLIEELRKDREEVRAKLQQVRELKREKKEVILKENVEKLRKRFEQLPAEKRARIKNILKKRMLAIKRERRVYEIIDSETNKQKKTTEFAIVVPQSNESVEIVEEIPKSVAQNTNQVSFSDEPEIIENDPIVKWQFNSVSEEKEVSYSIDGEVNDLATTVVVAGEEEITEEKEEIKEEGIKKETKSPQVIIEREKIEREKQSLLKRFFESLKKLFGR
ncbi:MAG: hypothetical protein QW331_03050 [Candidatus Woesearchaeota archaeon]